MKEKDVKYDEGDDYISYGFEETITLLTVIFLTKSELVSSINAIQKTILLKLITACGTFCSTCTASDACTDCVVGYYLDSGSCTGEHVKRIIR